jgi:hypothetical protein
VTFWPATVTTPSRAAPVFASTVIVVVPFPVPLAPDVILIQGTLLAAVHPHAPLAVIDTLVVPPVAATSRESGVT